MASPTGFRIPPGWEWIAFLSYDKDVKGHPPNKNVRLRICRRRREPKALVELSAGREHQCPLMGARQQALRVRDYRLASKETANTD